MSLYGFYANRQEGKLKWAYSRRAYYNAHLEYGLAKQRLLKLFGAGPVERIVDEVC